MSLYIMTLLYERIQQLCLSDNIANEAIIHTNYLLADCCSIWVCDPAASATGPDPCNDMVEATKILYQERESSWGML